MAEYTQKEIREKLETSQAWLERAIVAIYSYQTADEQATRETRDNNGVGFNGVDASFLSYCASWIMKGNHLDSGYLIKARKRMLKYSGQLTAIANQRERVAA